jgi:hypothetical protein
MRHLTQVPLTGTALPEQVLTPQASAEEAVAEEPAVEAPVAEQAASEQPVEAHVVEAPVAEPVLSEPVASEPVVSEPVAEPVVEPVAEVAPEAPAAAEPAVEPVAAAPASTEEAPHTIENSPLVEFHTPETERTVNLSERTVNLSEQPGQNVQGVQNVQGDQNAQFIPAGQAPNGFQPNQAEGFQSQNFQGQGFQGQNAQGGQYQGNPYQGQPYNAQQPYQGQVSDQDQATVALSNPYMTEPGNQGNGEDGSEKKGLLSGTKLWGVIGGALALLIVIILAIVMLIPRGNSNPASNSAAASSAAATSAEASSAAASSEASSAPASESAAAGTSASSAAPVAAAEAKMPEGEFKEYKKTVADNKDTIDIEKIKGDVSAGLIYYEFKPAEGVVNAFITSRDDKGNLTSGVSVLDSSRDGKEIKGTAWIDASSHSTPTRKLDLTGKGEWTIRVYDADSAPHYKKGEKFQSTMNYYAFTYEGTEATMEFQTSGPTTRGFTVLNATKNDPFFSSTIPTVKSNIQWVQSNKSYLQVRTDSNITWSIGTN